MADSETTVKPIGRRNRRSALRFDILLLVFLMIGWALIFIAATFGLQVSHVSWLEVGLVSKVSADYSVKPPNSGRVAPVKQQVLEAVKQDQILNTTVTPVRATPTLTQEPILTAADISGPLQVNAGGPYSGTEGSPVVVTAQLDASMLDLMPGVVSYIWDLDNDGQFDDFTGQTTPVTFYDEGEYIITVQATDLLGQVGAAAAIVSVSNVPPLIGLGPNILTEEGQEVVFAATASDPGRDILLYEWDFGDGSLKVTDTLTPRHVYKDNGNYTVRLTVRDNDDGVTEKTMPVKVINLPPVVDAGPDQQVNEAEEITFKGTATDKGVLDTLTYAWDFSYDGHTFTTEASGPSVSKIYPNGPLEVVAALRVRDKDGDEAIDTVHVTVGNVPPVIASVSNDGPMGEGSPLALTITATDVGNDPLTYAVDWEDDGSFDESGPENTVSHIWYNQGDYTVRIRVDDGDGGQVLATTQISTFNEPPVAVASADSEVLEGSPVSFDANDSSDPGLNDILTYSWDFGDGQSGDGESATHIYDDNGVYSATLTVTDDSGASGSAGVAVAIINAIPTVEAGVDVTVDEGTNVPVAYNGTATDPGVADVLVYTWDFGDGTTATDPAGTHAYSDLDGPTQRTVTLNVVDDDGGAASDTFNLAVRNLSPWNVNGGSYTCVENDTIELTASAEDIPADVPSLVFEWDLDSNPNYERPGRQVSYTCSQAGNQTVRLRVRDKDYNSSEDDAHDGETFGSAQVIISNALPVAVASANPLTITQNSSVTFDASGSYDPSPGPDTLTYRWSFGDGGITTTTSITTTHIYTDDGLYTASLRVYDNSGDFDDTTVLVWVINLTPNAVASVTPNPAARNAPVVFDGNSSNDTDGTIVSYQWDFGGGDIRTGAIVTNTFANAGNFNVMLTVTDDDNGVGAASVGFTVSNADPIAEAGPDQVVFEGDTALFDASATTDPDDNPVTLNYAWDFGDGTPPGAGMNLSHIFQNGPAIRTVTLTVNDNNGGIDTDTLQVTVNNAAPTANPGSYAPVAEGDSITFNGSGSDPGGDTLILYEWDFDYDGSNFTVDATGQNPSTSYPDGPATYTVALRVTDSDNAVSAVATTQVTVNNAPPIARATASATDITLGNPITFDASTSGDPGTDVLTDYLWEFGNGDSGSGVNLTYTYPATGTFYVTLTVTDEDGATDTDTTIVINVN